MSWIFSLSVSASYLIIVVAEFFRKISRKIDQAWKSALEILFNPAETRPSEDVATRTFLRKIEIHFCSELNSSAESGSFLRASGKSSAQCRQWDP